MWTVPALILGLAATVAGVLYWLGQRDEQAAVRRRARPKAGEEAADSGPAAVQHKQHRKHSNSAMYNLAATGDEDGVSRLLDRSSTDVNERCPAGKTPLHYATQRAHENVAALLVAYGADTNAIDKKHETPLHMACGSTGSHKTRDRYWRIAELLISRGADVNAQMAHNITPLYLAIKNNRHDLVGLLLKSGANPNIGDSEGYLPLFWAKKLQNQDTIRKLEALGAREFVKKAG